MAARPEKHLIMQAKRLLFQIQLPTGEFPENALTVLTLGKKATRVMNQVINQKIIKINRVH